MATQYRDMTFYGTPISQSTGSFASNPRNSQKKESSAFQRILFPSQIAQTQQSKVIELRNYDALNPWNKIRQEVLTWGDLEADWDDEGAVIPRADGLKFLERMISRFKDEGSPKAMPYIAGDGEFGLHWRLRGGKAVLSILADGRVLAFCPRGSGDPVRIKSTVDQQIDMQAFYKALREIAQ